MITSHNFHKRVHALIVMAVVVLVIFGLRLVDVQAVQADGYTKRANNEMVTSSVMLASRGTITDVNGVVLARSDKDGSSTCTSTINARSSVGDTFNRCTSIPNYSSRCPSCCMGQPSELTFSI